MRSTPSIPPLAAPSRRSASPDARRVSRIDRLSSVPSMVHMCMSMMDWLFSILSSWVWTGIEITE
jgi:hypothetical protein